MTPLAHRRRLSDEQGWATLWVLGLCVLTLGLGGISIDLGRALAHRRALVSTVDAAAAAGTSGLDERALRAGLPLRLDPTRAKALVLANLARQTEVHVASVDVAVDGDAITVTARSSIDLSLVRVLMAGRPLEVVVTATAHPRRST